MELQDFLVKQVQRFMQAILQRALDLVELIAFEGQEGLAAEMALILQQLSGLDARTLEATDVRTLSYLLNLRCEGESKIVMAEVLRLQAAFARHGSGYGTAARWVGVAHQLETQAQNVILSPTVAELLKRLQEKRKNLEGKDSSTHNCR